MTELDFKREHPKGFELLEKRQFKDAYQYFYNIDGALQNIYAKRKMIEALKGQKKNQEIIDFYTKFMVEEEKNDSDWLILARAFQFLGRYKEGIDCYYKIPAFEKKPEALFALVYLLKAGGEDGKAISYLKKDCIKTHPKALNLLGHAYIATQQYKRAIIAFDTAMVQKNVKVAAVEDATLGKFFALGYLEQKKEALRCLETLSMDRWTEKARYKAVDFYRELGDFSSAIQALKFDNLWEKNEKTVLSVACCLGEMNQLEEAKQVLHKAYKTCQSGEIALAYGRSFVDLNQFDEALDILNDPEHIKDLRVLSLVMKCFVHTGSFEKGNEVVEAFFSSLSQDVFLKRGEQYPYLLRMFAICKKELGYYEEAIAALNQIIQAGVDESEYALSLLLDIYEVQGQYSKYKETFKQGQEKFKSNAKFFLTEAKYYSFTGNKYAQEKCKELLEKAKKNFPLSWDVIFESIRIYSSFGEHDKVDALILESKETFKSKSLFLEKLEDLLSFKKSPLFLALKNVNRERESFIEIPESIRQKIAFLNDLDGHFYLVGDVLLALLEGNQNKLFDSAIEISTNYPFNKDEKLKYGLEEHPYLPGLYWVKTSNPSTISCESISKKGQWYVFNRARCHFTVNDIYLDVKTGTIYDLCGQGIEDAKHQRLRAVGDPKLLFKRPEAVLNAIQYFAKGYEPLPSIEDALRRFELNRDVLPWKDGFFRYLTRALLKNEKLKALSVRRLNQYGLLEKLFNYRGEVPSSDALLSHIECSSQNKRKRESINENQPNKRAVGFFPMPVLVPPMVIHLPPLPLVYNEFNDVCEGNSFFETREHYLRLWDVWCAMVSDDISRFNNSYNLLIGKDRGYPVIEEMGMLYNPYTKHHPVINFTLAFLTVSEMVSRFGGPSFHLLENEKKEKAQAVDEKHPVEPMIIEVEKPVEKEPPLPKKVITPFYCDGYAPLYHDYIRSGQEENDATPKGDFEKFIQYKVFVNALHALKTNDVQKFIYYVCGRIRLDHKVDIYYPSIVVKNPYAKEEVSQKEPEKIERRSLKALAAELKVSHLIKAAEEENARRYVKEKRVIFLTGDSLKPPSKEDAISSFKNAPM